MLLKVFNKLRMTISMFGNDYLKIKKIMFGFMK